MKKDFFVVVVAIVAILFLTVAETQGRILRLRPISPNHIRSMLRAAGREDAIPQGRVISHGIAAIKGFTLGIKSGILGSIVADGVISMANSTFLLNLTNLTSLADLTSFANLTSLTNLTSSSSSTSSSNTTTAPICFSSRSLDDDNVGTGTGRQAVTTGGTGTGTDTNSVTGTGATSPIATTVNTGTATETGTGVGTNTMTDSATTTATGTDGTINCIVLVDK